jgi:hypothetical protein
VKYLKELNKLTISIIEEAQELLQNIVFKLNLNIYFLKLFLLYIFSLLFSFKGSNKQQTQMAAEFFNKLISHADLTNESIVSLAIYLWELSLKNNQKTRLHVNNKCKFLLFYHNQNLFSSTYLRRI